MSQAEDDDRMYRYALWAEMSGADWLVRPGSGAPIVDLAAQRRRSSPGFQGPLEWRNPLDGARVLRGSPLGGAYLPTGTSPALLPPGSQVEVSPLPVPPSFPVNQPIVGTVGRVATRSPGGDSRSHTRHSLSQPRAQSMLVPVLVPASVTGTHQAPGPMGAPIGVRGPGGQQAPTGGPGRDLGHLIADVDKQLRAASNIPAMRRAPVRGDVPHGVPPSEAATVGRGGGGRGGGGRGGGGRAARGAHHFSPAMGPASPPHGPVPPIAHLPWGGGGGGRHGWRRGRRRFGLGWGGGGSWGPWWDGTTWICPEGYEVVVLDDGTTVCAPIEMGLSSQVSAYANGARVGQDGTSTSAFPPASTDGNLGPAAGMTGTNPTDFRWRPSTA
jgi:hypothetical protein